MKWPNGFKIGDVDLKELLNKNLSSLEDNAKQIYLNNYEPTIHEIKSVYADIMNFIKEKKSN